MSYFGSAEDIERVGITVQLGQLEQLKQLTQLPQLDKRFGLKINRIQYIFLHTFDTLILQRRLNEQKGSGGQQRGGPSPSHTCAPQAPGAGT